LALGRGRNKTLMLNKVVDDDYIDGEEEEDVSEANSLASK